MKVEKLKIYVVGFVALLAVSSMVLSGCKEKKSLADNAKEQISAVEKQVVSQKPKDHPAH